MNESAIRKNLTTLRTLVSICVGYKAYGRQPMDPRITLNRLIDLKETADRLWEELRLNIQHCKDAKKQLRRFEKQLQRTGMRVTDLLTLCVSTPGYDRYISYISRMLRGQVDGEALPVASNNNMFGCEYGTSCAEKIKAFDTLIQIAASEADYPGENTLSLQALKEFVQLVQQALDIYTGAEIACNTSITSLRKLLLQEQEGLDGLLQHVRHYFSGSAHSVPHIMLRLSRLDVYPF